MSPFTLRKEMQNDICENIIPYLRRNYDSKIRRAIIKSRHLPTIFNPIHYFSRATNNDWHIFYYAISKKLAEDAACIAVTQVQAGEGTYVYEYIVAREHNIYVFPPHFFSRYHSRFVKDAPIDKQELINQFKYMLKISLYQKLCVPLHKSINTHSYRKNQSYPLNRRTTSGIRVWLSQRQEPCISYALSCHTFEVPGTDLQRGRLTDRHDAHICELLAEKIPGRRHPGSGDPSGSWTQAYHGLFGRGSCSYRYRERQTEREKSQGGLAKGFRQGSEREHLQKFFIRLGARYRRIRKRPKGKPSPQLYAYKSEKLQELERQEKDGLIHLYFADESHICTEGYVPYGWQFRGEDVFIPSAKNTRLNIFGMIDRNNRYDGFSTTESITAEKVADFLDRLSFRINKDTFVVLDNAKVHRNKMMEELRPIWEKRGLYLFFLPPYSPHLNIAETLWRILKGKWISPADYGSTDSLFYATNRALAAVGDELYINFAHAA